MYITDGTYGSTFLNYQNLDGEIDKIYDSILERRIKYIQARNCPSKTPKIIAIIVFTSAIIIDIF